MRDLTGVAAQADVAVEGHGAEPDRPALLSCFEHLPKPYMVTPISTCAGGLLERKVLAPAIVELWAYRRVPVRPAQDDAANDRDT